MKKRVVTTTLAGLLKALGMIATDDQHLRYLTYAALGHDTRVAMEPTTDAEKARARQGCADQIEMFALMDVTLKEIQ